jgi:hypothetical protein
VPLAKDLRQIYTAADEAAAAAALETFAATWEQRYPPGRPAVGQPILRLTARRVKDTCVAVKRPGLRPDP